MPQWWRIQLPMQEVPEKWIRSLGREDSLEKGIAVFLPRDRGAWRAMVRGVSKSQTWLKRLGPHACNPVNGLSWCLSGKESACQHGRCRFSPWVRKIPWKRKWQPTPVFLPGEFHGQRSLAGYSPWGHKSWTWFRDKTATMALMGWVT